MSRHTCNVRFVILSATAFVALLVVSHGAAAQTVAPSAKGAGPPIGRASPFQPMYMATLEASFNLGDLGPDWRKELGIYGDETLLFRWKINTATAAKGRWEISGINGGLLAQGEVGAAPTPGNYYQFSLNFNTLGLSPPFKVRIQALTSNGSEVGHISPPVILNQAVNTGFGMCFTDGGLGLPIDDELEAIRMAHGVPALGGAVVTKHGLEVFDAVGIRKVESNPANQVAVTKYDKWHLGSDTKAMTSMLVGILRQYYPSIVGWNTTVAAAFPEWAGTMDATIAQTTLRQLLAHRSGLYKFTDEQNAKLTQVNVSVTQQRRNFTHAVAHGPYLLAPGVLYQYENANYVIAGAMLENLFQQSWEDLMTQYLFQPLGMASAGFGGPAKGGNPQPWGHYDDNGVYAPTDGDNPPSLGPAGTVHASLADWAKFIRLYLKGHEGGVTLTNATRTELMTAYTSSDPWFVVWPQSYGWGWGISASGDKVLAHDGSNTAWYARAVVFVDKGYALLVVTNAAALGDVNHGMLAVNDATAMLQNYHTACPDYSRSTRGSLSRDITPRPRSQ
jgi:CubicO group peptidase (beta-lactamase class C family)